MTRARRRAPAVAVLGSLAVPALAFAAGGDIDVTPVNQARKVNAHGTFTYPMSCAAGGPSCTGLVHLYATSQGPGVAQQLNGARMSKASDDFGSTAFTIAAGRKANVPVRLNAAGRRVLARRQGKAYWIGFKVSQASASGRRTALSYARIQIVAAK